MIVIKFVGLQWTLINPNSFLLSVPIWNNKYELWSGHQPASNVFFSLTIMMSNIYRIKYDDCQTVYQVINTRWDLSQPTSAFNRWLPEWTKQNTIEPIRVPISKARFCFATLAMTSFHQDHGFLRKHSRTFFFTFFCRSLWYLSWWQMKLYLIEAPSRANYEVAQLWCNGNFTKDFDSVGVLRTMKRNTGPFTKDNHSIVSDWWKIAPTTTRFEAYRNRSEQVKPTKQKCAAIGDGAGAQRG